MAIDNMGSEVLAAEAQKFQPQAPQAQQTGPKTDRKFYSEAQKYVADLKDAQDGDNEGVEAYLSEVGHQLPKLARENKEAPIDPKDVALAIGQVARGMEFKDQLVAEGREPEYLRAKDLFMSSCSKLYPEAAVQFGNSDKIGVNLSRSLATVDQALAQMLTASRIDTRLDPAQAASLADKDPQRLAGIIDSALFDATGSAGPDARVAFGAFNNGDITGEQYDQELARIAVVNREIYNLQLMRDALTERMYARDDTTPSDMKAIDDARSLIDQLDGQGGEAASGDRPAASAVEPEVNNQSGAQTEEAKPAAEKPKEEQNSSLTNEQILKSIDGIIDDSFSRSESSTAINNRGAEFALKGMRNLYPNPNQLCDRIRQIVAAVDASAARLIQQGKDPLSAKNLAINTSAESILNGHELRMLQQASEQDRQATVAKHGQTKDGFGTAAFAGVDAKFFIQNVYNSLKPM